MFTTTILLESCVFVVEYHCIGLRHCAELNYGNNVTSAANFIIEIMTGAKRVL